MKKTIDEGTEKFIGILDDQLDLAKVCHKALKLRVEGTDEIPKHFKEKYGVPNATQSSLKHRIRRLNKLREIILERRLDEDRMLKYLTRGGREGDEAAGRVMALLNMPPSKSLPILTGAAA